MLQRKNTGYHDGDFSLPAGHVDGGEKLVDAAIREAKEELGILINSENLNLVHVLHRKSDSDDNSNERIDFYFEATAWQGEITNEESEKCEALKWFDLNDLPVNAIAPVKSVLHCLSNGDIYSNLGWD